MNHFYKELSTKEQTFLDDLFNTEVLITEKIDGQAFSAEWTEKGWVFYKRDANNPINLLDRTIMKSYEDLIDFFESKPESITNKFKFGMRFEMEYVKSLKPNLISYDSLPTNNLVLHSISFYNDRKLTNKITDIEDIKKYAKILDVDSIPVIFQGKLNKSQIEDISSFLKTPKEDLISRFKTESFTQYIFSVLDPSRKKTYLQSNLEKPIEGIVFYFDDKVFLAKLVDPAFEQSILDKMAQHKEADIPDIKTKKFTEDFFNFVAAENIKNYVNDDKGFISYLKIIGDLFLNFYTKNKNFKKEYKGIFHEQSDTFKQEDFKINPRFLPDDIKKLIKSNEDIEFAFKLAIMNLKYTKKRFLKTENPLTKELVTRISSIVKESKFITFKNFLFESLIQEGNKEYENGLGKEKINVIIGKFQPFTSGHQKMVDELYSLNGLPVYIFSVRKKQPILSEKLTENIFKQLIKDDKKIENFKFIDRGLIADAMNVLYPDFEPEFIGCGTDREKDYTNQLNFINKNWTQRRDNIKIHVTTRTDEDVSATKVRNAVIEDDFKTFEKMTPKSVHKFYKELQNELKK